MIWSKPELLSMAVDLSSGKVEPALTCSIIHVLSEWMPATVNHSPENVIYGLSEAEFQGMQATYGLMQFSGLQARQNGFTGAFNDLLEAETNLNAGIAILQKCLAQGSRQEISLLLYLGRSRADSIGKILNLRQPYEKLISERPS